MGRSNPTPYTILKYREGDEEKDKRFYCEFPDCGKSYAHKASLVRHIEDKHPVASTDDINYDDISDPMDCDIGRESIGSNSSDESDAESDVDSLIEYSSDEEDEEDGEEEENQDDVRARIDSIMAERHNLLRFNDAEWDNSTNEGHPFKNPQTMIMMCVYNSYAGMMSREQLKTFLYGVERIVELAVETTKAERVFRMPSSNMIMKGDQNQMYDGPSMTTTTTDHTVSIRGEEKKSKCSANLPSEHLRLSMANPKKCKFITALPDRTVGISKGLITGEKWLKNPHFQPPHVSVNGKDFWVGDVVKLNEPGQVFLIKSFFCKDGDDLVDGYFLLVNGDKYGIIPEICSVPQSLLKESTNKAAFGRSNCYTLGSAEGNIPSLSTEHSELLLGQNPSKIEKPDSAGEFYKVVIAPIMLFTDDTSGGTSKQHMPYESWSMTYAALPFEDRGRRENTMFIGCASKSEGVNAMHFVPGLSSDLKKLENGVLMFSCEYNELVLVKAPIMLISADNPAHSDICGLLQQTTLYFCRKCYILKINKKKGKTLAESGVTVEKLNQRYPIRTRPHYLLAASSNDRKAITINGAVPGGPLSAHDLSFKQTGSQDLLKLDSFDPSLDTPVEALHCLPLGVVKYLVEHLVKDTLAGRRNASKLERLTVLIHNNRDNQSYSRNFRKHLRHVGSFVGRDFKQLIQILPAIIETEFTDPVADRDMLLLNEPLKVLAKLCSLIFVRQVHCLEDYILCIKTTVESLTKALYDFDTATELNRPFSTRPKVHYLHHLHEDIRRFGCALQYETEKGEMFNKFIREQLLHTNRHSPSKDVARRFAKQELLKHVVDGGSWINKANKRTVYGDSIKTFLCRHETMFRLKFFGARDYAENNYEQVKKSPGPGFAGVFKSTENNSFFVGVVDDAGNCIKVYTIGERNSCGLLKCSETNERIELSKLRAVGILDMHLLPSLINLNKFGSITLLKESNISYNEA